MPEPAPQVYRFDRYRLDVSNRQLLLDGTPVPLPAKAFDMLVVLIENRGRLIGKDELFSRVWPDQIVEESNLTVQVSAIRKALGDRKENPRYIVTVPGHGYRFTADLEIPAEARANIETPTPRSTTRPRAVLIAGVAVIVIAVGVFLSLQQSRPSTTTTSSVPIKSIAILPFKPLVAGSRNESLELGMAETLITRLSGLRDVIVRPTSAVSKYGGLGQDAIAAGRELRVESVLDGSLQRWGNRLRVTVRLARVADGRTLWSERFDENFTDIFAVQDRVAERVATVLAVRLRDPERKQLGKHHTQMPEAYQLYLLGRFFWAKSTADGFRKSIASYNSAIKMDPAYALAYAGLADSYNFLGSFGAIPLKESHSLAKAAAMKALELDDDLGEAHASLAAIITDYDWNWQEAERHYNRAIDLNANYSTAHRLYSQYLSLMGRPDEAIAEAKRALDIDPLSLGDNNTVGLAYYRARKFDQTVEYSRKTLEMDSTFVPAHIMLGLAFLQQGLSDQSIAEFSKGRELSHNSPRLSALLAYSYAHGGRTVEARKILDELNHLAPPDRAEPFDLAGVHIGLGNIDEAFKLLEISFQERSWMLGYLNVEPLFDPLRSDPRFKDLVRRVGLPH